MYPRPRHGRGGAFQFGLLASGSGLNGSCVLRPCWFRTFSA
jgi:hypothetical protein